MDPRIRRATEYIEQNLLQRFSSEKIAQAAGLSPRYLTKLFRNGTGMTPLCYYIKFRMDYARFLLEESGLSVKQAALTLGYPDPYSFSKQFKKAMGYPPSRCQADI